MKVLHFLLTILTLHGIGGPAFAAAVTPGRADLVRLTLDAPVIVRAEIARASALSRKLSPGLAFGFRRHLVRARLTNVLIAPGYVPPQVEYLVDVPADSRGRVPELKGMPVLLFLDSSRLETQYRLIAPWAQVDWTAEREAYVRIIAREALEPDLKGMRVLGLGQAFHVPGNLPGESESQIFVTTQSGRPVSLVVLARPGQRRTFSVATGDVIDDAAGNVAPGSLLWYHLACGLPATLPASSTETLDSENAAAVSADYRFVRESLGACDRVYR